MADPSARRDKRLDEWLRRELGDPYLRLDSLGAMTLATARDDQALTVPAEVMTAWHKEIAATWRSVAQAEEHFISVARRQGWTWDRIGAVLGLESAAAASSRQAELRSELEQTHPSKMPIPWSGEAG